MLVAGTFVRSQRTQGRKTRHNIGGELVEHRLCGPASELQVEQYVVRACSLERLQMPYQPAAAQTVAVMDLRGRYVRIGDQIDLVGQGKRLERTGRDGIDCVVPLPDQLHLEVQGS